MNLLFLLFFVVFRILGQQDGSRKTAYPYIGYLNFSQKATSSELPKAPFILPFPFPKDNFQRPAPAVAFGKPLTPGAKGLNLHHGGDRRASCPGGWTRVVPTPAQSGKEGR